MLLRKKEQDYFLHVMQESGESVGVCHELLKGFSLIECRIPIKNYFIRLKINFGDTVSFCLTIKSFCFVLGIEHNPV